MMIRHSVKSGNYPLYNSFLAVTLLLLDSNKVLTYNHCIVNTLEETKMYANPEAEQNMIFVRSRIKYSQGVYTSTGQRWFWMERNQGLEQEDGVTPYGVPYKKGDRVLSIDQIMSWADYGVRSKMPVVHVAVLDRVGVRAFYKLGGKGNLRDGWGPDPKKTKLLWERPANVVGLPEEQPKEVKKSTKVGNVGDTIIVEGTVIKHEVVYNNYGTVDKFMIKDANDNLFMYKGTKFLAEKGGFIKIESKVKDHFEMGAGTDSWLTILGGKGKNSITVLAKDNFQT